MYGVPQGSVLGPILFVLYTTPLSDIIANHSVNHQLFADDTQLQKSAPLSEVTNLTKELNACTDNIKTWMTENQLKLNDNQPLQQIQNFAARLVLLASRHHHATPLLEKLHWLPISERIKYKVACMCFSAINGSGPAYLSELLHVYTPSRTLRSSSDTRMPEI